MSEILTTPEKASESWNEIKHYFDKITELGNLNARVLLISDSKPADLPTNITFSSGPRTAATVDAGFDVVLINCKDNEITNQKIALHLANLKEGGKVYFPLTETVTVDVESAKRTNERYVGLHVIEAKLNKSGHKNAKLEMVLMGEVKGSSTSMDVAYRIEVAK
jgi:hypothetical protein